MLAADVKTDGGFVFLEQNGRVQFSTLGERYDG